jgi:lipooligosaccharide transport system ATP-binding protein
LVVRVQNLTKKFGDFKAVDAVSFEIERGECFGLLGPNGAGKSTVISMLYGATVRTSGEIKVFDFDPKSQSRQIKKRIGVVPQANSLDEGMDVLSNMLVFARFLGVEAKQRRPRVEELLDFMSLSHKAKSPISSLSGGMQRRLVFVRALLNDPDFVILDEPTTGLDPAVRKVIWDRVSDLLEKKKTVLLTTHYMDEAEILCDRIVIMNEGRIQAIGSPRELIQQHCPGYVAMVKKQDAAWQTLGENTPAIVEKRVEKSSIYLRSGQLGALTSYLDNAKVTPELIRPANLEDAFLKITGRELSSDA